MTAEQKARQKIDRLLEDSGWIAQDCRGMNISAGGWRGGARIPAAIRPVDYLLYADRKVIGVVEAKPEGHTLTGVEIQSAKYTSGLPANLPHYRLPLPFAYESTGIETQFTNSLEPDFRSHPRPRGAVQPFTSPCPHEPPRPRLPPNPPGEVVPYANRTSTCCRAPRPHLAPESPTRDPQPYPRLCHPQSR